jgi:hypothetical protein
VSDSTSVLGLLTKMGFSQKNGAWRRWNETSSFKERPERVTVAAQIDPKGLVFVDEMGSNTSLPSHYAWSKRGERGLTVRFLATAARTPPSCSLA